MTDATKAEQPLPPSWPLVAIGFGSAIGLLVHVVLELDLALLWEFGLVQAALTVGLAMILTAAPDDRRAPSVFALALSGLLALLSVTSIYRFGNDLADRVHGLSAFLAIESVVFGVLALAGFQAWQDRTPGEASGSGLARQLKNLGYASFFEHLWDNVLIAFVSGCFVCLFWLLLVLFAQLFESVGVAGFSDLIEEPIFIWPATCGTIAVAVVFLRWHRRMFGGLRSIVLTLFAALTPVFLILSAGFLAVLLSGGFARMASLVSASATLLILTGFGLVFVNAVVRTDDTTQATSRPLWLSAMLLPPCLLVFCGFAVYAIGLRIDQHGLTPDRAIVAVVTGVLSLWCLAYVASLIARQDWMARARRINTAMAILVAGTTVLLQTPLADPYHLSAESQYRRLVNGAVSAAQFDYGFLKFELGRNGRDVLARLEIDSGDADAEVVAERLADLSQVANIWDWENLSRAKGIDIQNPDGYVDVADTSKTRKGLAEALADRRRVKRVPATLELPDTLKPSVFGLFTPELLRCGQSNGLRCAVAAIDLMGETGPEYLLAFGKDDAEFNLILLDRRRDRTGWRAQMVPTAEDPSGLWAAFLGGDLTAIPTDHRDLRLGDHEVRLYRPHLLVPDAEGP